MALTMRPTGLGFGIDKDCHDYTVYKWNVGRIYETRGGLDSLRSFRSMTVTGPATRSDLVESPPIFATLSTPATGAFRLHGAA